jgi:hypothetical protein
MISDINKKEDQHTEQMTEKIVNCPERKIARRRKSPKIKATCPCR